MHDIFALLTDICVENDASYSSLALISLCIPPGRPPQLFFDTPSTPPIDSLQPLFSACYQNNFLPLAIHFA